MIKAIWDKPRLRMILGTHQLNKNPIEPKPAPLGSCIIAGIFDVSRAEGSQPGHVEVAFILQYMEKLLHQKFHNEVFANRPRVQQNDRR